MQKFLDDYRKMFTENKRLLIIMILAVFLIVFFAFGGCNSCSCSGCASCSCSGCGGNDGGDDNGGWGDVEEVSDPRLHKVYEADVVSASSLIVENGDIAVTMFYPESEFTYTENSDEFYAPWFGRAQISNGEFAIQADVDYISNNYKKDNSNCETFEDILEVRSQEVKTTNELVTIGGKEGVMQEYNGIAIYYFPGNEKQCVKFAVVPKDYDPNSNSAHSDLMKVVYTDEVQALLNAATITTIAEAPTDTDIVFSAMQDSRVFNADETVTWDEIDTSSADFFPIDQSVGNDSYTMRFVGAQRCTNGEGLPSVTFFCELTNNGDAVICQEDVVYIRGFQHAGCDLTGNYASTYIPVEPGQTVKVTKTYILNEAEDSVKISATDRVPDGNGGLMLADESYPLVDAIIVE